MKRPSARQVGGALAELLSGIVLLGGMGWCLSVVDGSSHPGTTGHMLMVVSAIVLPVSVSWVVRRGVRHMFGYAD